MEQIENKKDISTKGINAWKGGSQFSLLYWRERSNLMKTVNKA